MPRAVMGLAWAYDARVYKGGKGMKPLFEARNTAEQTFRLQHDLAGTGGAHIIFIAKTPSLIDGRPAQAMGIVLTPEEAVKLGKALLNNFSYKQDPDDPDTCPYCGDEV